MNQSSEFRVACLGDIVGRYGRSIVKSFCENYRDQLMIDCIIANAENAAGGVGVTGNSIDELRRAGVDFFTLGDHTWQQRDFRSYLERCHDYCIRPANFPEGAPGRGWLVYETDKGFKLGIFNIIGRVFMNYALECPFRAADSILAGPLADCDLVICDLHAEATSEKVAMGRYLDGRCALVYGTHTHVQTADEQLLPQGTAFITDIGMCGSTAGVIGMDTAVAHERFLTGLPKAYKVAKGAEKVSGILVTFDAMTYKAKSIERLSNYLQ